MCKLKAYLKPLLTGINLLITLAITFVVLTGFVASYDFGLFGMIVSSNAFYLAVILAVVFGGATILYMALNLKNSKVTFADMLGLALVFIGFIFFFYVLIATGSLNGRRIIASLLLIAVGVAHVLLRAFSEKKDKEEKTYEKTSIKGYYAKVFEKYPLPVMILLSIVVVCLLYLVLSAYFLKSYFQGSRVVVALTILLLLPLVIALGKKISSKVVNIVDGLLIPIAVGLLFTFFTLVLKDYSPLKMSAWAIMLGAYIIVLDIRFKKFDLSAEIDAVKPVANESYAKALLGTHNIIDILAISSTMAVVSAMLLRSGVVAKAVTNGIDVGFLPVAVIILTMAGIIFYACVSALLGLKKKAIGKGDFWLGVIITFAVCGFISLLFHSSVLLAYALVIFSIFVLIVLLLRKKNLND